MNKTEIKQAEKLFNRFISFVEESQYMLQNYQDGFLLHLYRQDGTHVNTIGAADFDGLKKAYHGWKAKEPVKD